MVMNVADDDVRYPTLHVVASILAWASAVVNPFIYAFRNRQYQQAFARVRERGREEEERREKEHWFAQLRQAPDQHRVRNIVGHITHGILGHISCAVQHFASMAIRRMTRSPDVQGTILAPWRHTCPNKGVATRTVPCAACWSGRHSFNLGL